MNQEKKVIKISDVIENQIPEFIVSENPNFVEFLKQYYISQEFQGSNVDIAENLISYRNLDSFDSNNLISQTTLTSSVDFFDDVINVQSTKGWPNEYGLLKIDNEIITYTGITTNSFTGCIRGFSGTSSLTQENNPEFLVFSETESESHTENSIVENLSNLFLNEFFRKIKYQFTPGFEELDFAEEINPQNFISKARTFYQTKGTDEAFKILFKVLYAEDVKIIKPDDYCFTPSDDKWRVVESFICELVDGNPYNINGQTLYQNDFPQYDIVKANGSIYNVESFSEQGETFYKIQIFSGYSNNLNPKGSIEGTFYSTPKTFIVEDIEAESDIITVDSTVGFGNSGILEIGGLNISYTDKTNDQFLNCIGITTSISKKTKVFSDHFVYAYELESSNVVKFKLCNVLSKLESSDVLYAYDGDPIKIDHLGSTEESVFLNSLIYNHPITISSGRAVSAITDTIRANQKEAFSIANGVALCKYPHYLKNGDIVDLYADDILILSNISVSVIKTNIYEFSIPILQIQNPSNLLNKQISFRRKVKKSSYDDLYLTSNVQDSYVDSDSYYLTSNGLPEYSINPLNYNKSFSVGGEYLTSGTNHYFYDGDEIVISAYLASPEFTNQIGIKIGTSYYVHREDNKTIRLSQSRKDIENSSFVSFEGLISIGVTPASQYNRQFGSNKLFKKIPKVSKISRTKYDTAPGGVGVFVNGVELRNYKSFDKVYYGQIDSVTVLNSGSNYDITNPPRFKVIYENQEKSNTTIIPNLKGSLLTLSVTDPGFDYIEVPTVKVLGNTNANVVTQVKMKNVVNEVKFNAGTSGLAVNTTTNTFNFSSPHRFVVGEPVIYKTFGSSPIGIGTQLSDGYLSNDSVYYVSNVGAGTSMSLAFNRTDAISGQNLINLRSFGGGIQSFISTLKKRGIDEVNVIECDGEFEYKKVSFIGSDVNLQENTITVKNHGFSTGDEVVYTWNPINLNRSIGGLSAYQTCYIVKVDENTFKLSSSKNTINYIDFTSVSPNATYFLEYSPIRIEIVGTISKYGLSDIGYSATIVPTVKGTVIGAAVQSNPTMDYFGDKNILNYEKYPEIEVVEGINASFQPIIVDGKISQVIVRSSGSGYYNSFELVVKGSGVGAKLQPIISNGEIVDVEVINGGIEYTSSSTYISIVPIGTGVRLKANLSSWTVNSVERNRSSSLDFTNDGGEEIFGKNYSLTNNTYGTYFLTKRLKDFLEIEKSNTTHSAIVGWAYDGCPIYGPYAYKNIDGSGGIVRMRSGYVRQKNVGSDVFKFVEEYVFTNSGTLDRHNGRFCTTPEYPNGVYAYFCTFDDTNAPEFPYVIGPQFNCILESSNLELKNNQELDFNKLNIVRWTTPYRVLDNSSKYEYFEFFENSNKNDIIIEKSSSGFVDEIQVVDGGINYQVNDLLEFNNDGTSGSGVMAKVSEISGVGINSISSQSIEFSDVDFIFDCISVVGIASTYHSFEDQSYVNISNISQSSLQSIEGFRKISVETIATNLSDNVGTSSTTGIVTSIKVDASITSFDIDSQLYINENEIVKVVGLDYQNNLLNVLRPSNGPSHAAKEGVVLLPNKFSFSAVGLSAPTTQKNEAYYFNSAESVSTGTSLLPGAGNTLTINPLGLGVPYVKYVRTGGIYLPNNKFKTGDKVNYTPGTSTIVSNYGNLNLLSELYVIKLEQDVVGLVTSRSDISNIDKILTYTNSGTGKLHKFTTDKDLSTGNITKNICIVSTAATHELNSGDIINLNVVSGITTTFVVTYSSNRVLINSEINPKIDVYANDEVVFDLSSATLSGKDFNIYTDENFLNPYFGNTYNGIEVIKTSTNLTLSISEYTPRNLFYNLSTTTTDITVSEYNQIKINDSLYNSDAIVTSTDNYEFTVDLKSTPERTNYTDSSELSYKVLSENVFGSISKIELMSKGGEYKKLPKVSSINSTSGNGASLFANSYTIGRIEKTKVNNTRFICPSDKTLKPESNVFSALKLTDNYTVDSYNIISGGQNYFYPPNIKLYNSKENKINSDFSAVAILKNNSVNDINIINSGSGLKSSDNQLIFTENDNGIKILDVAITGLSPYTVTLTLQTPPAGFSTSNPLPILLGDKIFVEGIASNGNGFNSSDYNYQPFIVTYVDAAYGSQDAAIIRYQLNSNPGSYVNGETYNASVVPYSYIPKVDLTLKESVFYNNEYVNESQIINNIKNSPISGLLKVDNSKNIKVNDIIVGKSSRSKGTVIEIDNFNSIFNSDYSVSEVLGGVENRGYLSSNVQKLSDNDYYQKFSYSLKSSKSFSDWNSPVSDTSHIAGYKKFSDLVVESVGIGTTQPIKTDSSSTINVILDSYVDVNSFYDYDLVNEIDIEDSNGQYSQYLRFNRLKLAPSLNSTDNRVLSVDDISNLFITESIIPKIILDSSFANESTALKYEFYLTSTNSFLGDFVYPQTFELLVIRTENTIQLVPYSYYFDIINSSSNPFFGLFTAEVNPANSKEVIVYFSPTNPFVTTDIKAIKEISPNSVGIATTSFGYIKNVEVCQEFTGPGICTFYSIPVSECNSGTMIIGISSTPYNVEKSFESSFVNTGSDVLISRYAEGILNDLGTITVVQNGSNLEFNYTSNVGIAVTIQANLKLFTNTYAGFDSIEKNLSILSSSTVTTNLPSTGITTVSGIYGYTKYIIEVEQTVGLSTQRSILQINSIHAGDYLNNIQYDINGNIDVNDLVFETNYNIIGNTYTLYFNPTTSADYKLTIYESSLLSPNQ